MESRYLADASAPVDVDFGWGILGEIQRGIPCES